jgi:hypothetical protein
LFQDLPALPREQVASPEGFDENSAKRQDRTAVGRTPPAKVRDAEINSALHSFRISGKGIVIEPDSTTAEKILAQAIRQGGYQGSVRAPATGHHSED